MSESVPPEVFTALVESLNRIQVTRYTNVVGFVYLILEYLQTLELEVLYIWRASRLSAVKLLFFGTRYLGFIGIPLLFVYDHGHGMSPGGCKILYGTALVCISVSTACSDALNFLRIRAMANESKPITIYLCTHFVVAYIALYVTLIRGISISVFEPLPAPFLFPYPPNCYLPMGKLVAPLVITLVNIVVACILGFWLTLVYYRNSKNPFIRIFSLHGNFYFLMMAAITAGNLALLLKASGEYQFLLVTAHQAVHASLSARIILRMRKTAQPNLSIDNQLTTFTATPRFQVYKGTSKHIVSDDGTVVESGLDWKLRSEQQHGV